MNTSATLHGRWVSNSGHQALRASAVSPWVISPAPSLSLALQENKGVTSWDLLQFGFWVQSLHTLHRLSYADGWMPRKKAERGRLLASQLTANKYKMLHLKRSNISHNKLDSKLVMHAFLNQNLNLCKWENVRAYSSRWKAAKGRTSLKSQYTLFLNIPVVDGMKRYGPIASCIFSNIFLFCTLQYEQIVV